ncbi:MAG: peptidyl-prolyl cis-trans isomerase [Acidobacteriaceae bacterium]
MIRILQQDSRIVKLLFALIIGAAIVTMVITLVPGIFDNGEANDVSVYATVHSPGLLGRVFGQTHSIKMDDVEREADAQMQQQQLPDFYRSFVVQRAGQLEVERAVLEEEANHLGLRVSDGDLRNYLEHGPYAEYLFPDGKFIGQDQYINFVESAFHLPVTEFEDEVKSELEIQRLQALVTGGVSVSDSAVRASYVSSGTKVKFNYAVISADSIKQSINPTDEQLQEFFKKNAALYAHAVPETRKIRFFSFATADIPGGAPPVSDAAAQAYYQAHQSQYQSPAEVKTRHILIAVAKGASPSTVAAAKAKAEDVLKQLKAGGNFAALAKKYSDDPGSKDQGGELPLIATSELDPAYAQAAMALSPGQTSGLVRSSFGFHIIQTEAKQEATVKPFAAVKSSIVEQLQSQAAANAAQAYAAQLTAEAKAKGMQQTADAHKLKLVTTGFIGKDAVIPSLADSTGLLSAAFNALKGAPPASASVGDGYAIFQVDDIQPAHAPAFADYKPHILDDYRAEKEPEMMDAQLIKLADLARKLGGLGPAAAQMHLKLQTSDLVGRDAQITDIGSLTGPAAVLFTMPVGGISGPINEGANGAIVQLLDRQQPTPDEVQKHFDATRETLVEQQRQEAFSVFVDAVMRRYEKAGAIIYSKKSRQIPLGS